MFGLTTTDDADPLATRRRDRRLFAGLIAAAMLAFVGLDALGRPLLGVGTYWLLAVAAFAVLHQSDHAMDERDHELERRASHLTVMLIGVGLIVLGPGLGALADANVYDAPAVLDGVALGWAVLFAVWIVAYLRERRAS